MTKTPPAKKAAKKATPKTAAKASPKKSAKRKSSKKKPTKVCLPARVVRHARVALRTLLCTLPTSKPNFLTFYEEEGQEAEGQEARGDEADVGQEQVRAAQPGARRRRVVTRSPPRGPDVKSARTSAAHGIPSGAISDLHRDHSSPLQRTAAAR